MAVHNSLLTVEFKAIGLQGLAIGEETMDPYVKAYQGSQCLGSTPVIKGVQQYIWGKSISWPSVTCESGEPIFFEVWDWNYGPFPDKLLGLFVIHPVEERLAYQTSIIWDINERTGVTRTGIAAVKLSQTSEMRNPADR